MAQALIVNQVIPVSTDPKKALKILSKSVYRELRSAGYEPTQIVALATEIVGLVASEIHGDGPARRQGPAKSLD